MDEKLSIKYKITKMKGGCPGQDDDLQRLIMMGLRFKLARYALIYKYGDLDEYELEIYERKYLKYKHGVEKLENM